MFGGYLFGGAPFAGLPSQGLAATIGNVQPVLYAGAGADDATVGTVAWSNPGNITAEDGTTAIVSTAGTTHYLKASSFGFAVPAGLTIEGILVEIKSGCPVSTVVTESSIKLVKGGVISGTDHSTAAGLPAGALAYRLYGGATDRWGLALTPADVNASNFGVVFSVQVGVGAGTNGQVDAIRITVYALTAQGQTVAITRTVTRPKPLLSEGQAVSRGASTVARTFSASQGQAVSRGVSTVVRTIPRQAQAQSVSRGASIARKFTPAAQGQSVSRAASTAARTFSASGGQALTSLRTATRTLTASQSQSVTYLRTAVRIYAAPQAQSLTYLRVAARSLAITAGQALTRPLALSRTFSASGSQALTRPVSISTALSASGGQGVTQAAALARGFPAAQSQSLVQAAALVRGFQVAAGQALSRSGAITATRSLAQAQTPVVSSALAISLSASQSQALALALALARRFVVAQAASLAAALALSRSMAAAQSQTSIQTAAIAVALNVSQSASATLTASIAAIQATSQGAVVATAYGVARSFQVSEPGNSSVSSAVARTLSVAGGQSSWFAAGIAREFDLAGDATVSFGGSRARVRVFAASQDQAVSLALALARLLAASQVQQAAFARAITTALAAAQSQALALNVQVPGAFTAGQGQSVSIRSTVGASFTAICGSSVNARLQISRSFVLGGTQAVNISLLSTSVLLLAQNASPTRSGVIACTLAASGGQACGATRSVGSSKALYGPQTVSRVSAALRTLALSQAATSTLTRMLTRTLQASEGQTVSTVRVVVPGGRSHTFTVSQVQVLSAALALARSLRASQAAVVARRASVARTRSLAGGQATSASFALHRALTVSAPPASATLRVRVRRIARCSAGQAISRAGAIQKNWYLHQAQQVRKAAEIQMRLDLAQSQTVAVRALRFSYAAPTASQGQSLSSARALARSLRLAQGTHTRRTVQIATGRSLSAPSTARIVRRVLVSYTAAQGQNVSEFSHLRRTSVYACTQRAASWRSLAIHRSLATGQAQSAAVSSTLRLVRIKGILTVTPEIDGAGIVPRVPTMSVRSAARNGVALTATRRALAGDSDTGSLSVQDRTAIAVTERGGRMVVTGRPANHAEVDEGEAGLVIDEAQNIRTGVRGNGRLSVEET